MNDRTKWLVAGGLAVLVLLLYLLRQGAGSAGGVTVYQVGSGADTASANAAAATIETSRLQAASAILGTLAQGFSTSVVTGLEEQGATARAQLATAALNFQQQQETQRSAIQGNYAAQVASYGYQAAVEASQAQVAVAKGQQGVEKQKNVLDFVGGLVGGVVKGLFSFL